MVRSRAPLTNVRPSGVTATHSTRPRCPGSGTASSPVLTLRNRAGETIDFESARVGFRQVEIDAHGILKLNGQRLILRGVNRHEHCPEAGAGPTTNGFDLDAMNGPGGGGCGGVATRAICAGHART